MSQESWKLCSDLLMARLRAEVERLTSPCPVVGHVKVRTECPDCTEEWRRRSLRLEGELAASYDREAGWKTQATQAERERNEALAQVAVLLEAIDRCEDGRGAFSCYEPHDYRCPKSRATRPEDWKGEWVCECGREALDRAVKNSPSEARALLDRLAKAEARVLKWEEEGDTRVHEKIEELTGQNDYLERQLKKMEAVVGVAQRYW